METVGLSQNEEHPVQQCELSLRCPKGKCWALPGLSFKVWLFGFLFLIFWRLQGRGMANIWARGSSCSPSLLLGVDLAQNHSLQQRGDVMFKQPLNTSNGSTERVNVREASDYMRRTHHWCPGDVIICLYADQLWAEADASQSEVKQGLTQLQSIKWTWIKCYRQLASIVQCSYLPDIN